MCPRVIFLALHFQPVYPATVFRAFLVSGLFACVWEGGAVYIRVEGEVGGGWGAEGVGGVVDAFDQSRRTGVAMS